MPPGEWDSYDDGLWCWDLPWGYPATTAEASSLADFAASALGRPPRVMFVPTPHLSPGVEWPLRVVPHAAVFGFV
jgi:hypothetical protein